MVTQRELRRPCISSITFLTHSSLDQIKKTVFQVTGLKILGSVGTHLFFYYFFSGKIYNLMHFERHFAFQSA